MNEIVYTAPFPPERPELSTGLNWRQYTVCQNDSLGLIIQMYKNAGNIDATFQELYDVNRGNIVSPNINVGTVLTIPQIWRIRAGVD